MYLLHLECFKYRRLRASLSAAGRFGLLLTAIQFLWALAPAEAQTPRRRTTPGVTTPTDSIARARQDSLRALRTAGRRPPVRWNDRRASRFSNRVPRSPFILRDPRSVSTEFRLDSLGQIAVTERLITPGVATPDATRTETPPARPVPGIAPPGSSVGLPYRPGEAIDFEEYNRLQNQRVRQNIWREYSAKRDGQSAVSGRGIIPKIDLPPAIDRLFGGGGVDFRPNGFVMLDFGYLHQAIDNPSIPVRQRRMGNFIFNQQISINFNGKVGEKLGLLTNFDTKSSFNFENMLKLNYRPTAGQRGGQTGLPGLGQAGTGLPGVPGMDGNASNLPGQLFQPQDASIIQAFEAGNISWPISSQLIPGVQNLFGVKTQLRFGKLNTTLVFSQQRSRQEEIVLRGGSLQRPFEVRVDTYDENRHFFLSQFFRNNYERSLRNLPMVTSGVTITRLEVYVTNRTNTTDNLRNIVGLSDLGETNRFNQEVAALQPVQAGGSPASNGANGLYDKVRLNQAIRQVDRTAAEIEGTLGLSRGIGYDLLRGAKRLTDREYKFQPELGYISLTTPLRNDEVLAVAYEYTLNGRKYKVGELTEDYQNRQVDEVIVLKMLKSATIRNNTQLPMWDLMMKNVYALNATQLNRQNFQLRIIYRDDLTGIDNPTLQESSLKDVPLVQVFNLDELNPQNDRQRDGNFDYVENVTVDSRFGRIFFPVLEPFGSYLSRQFEAREEEFREKYVFNELYRTTMIDAQQVASKNKFFLKGSYQSSLAGDVALPYGVDPQSVQVLAGGVPLMPGSDYDIEPQIGRIRFLNDGVMNSGREIVIRYERPDLFQNQIRRLFGTRLDYRLSPDVNLGMTAMSMRETPPGFLTRVALGNEPINNTILGFDASVRRESRFLTKMLDRLPLIQTKEVSTIQFQGEVAQLLPGVSPRVNNQSFIDDFEAARTIFDLTRQPTRWRLGATPQQFPQGTLASPLESAFQRARISVYSVDQTFYQETFDARTPQNNLTAEDRKNFYEKPFLPNQLFPGRSQRIVNLPEQILDVAYFPRERGMYNYSPTLDRDGRLSGNPRRNFGSVSRAITSDADFDNANIENLEFWMMDPFLPGENGVVRDGFENRNNSTGGKVYFNLGEISEDVVKDSRYNFENGLPANDDTTRTPRVDFTPWGKVTRQQFLTQAFDNQPGARQRQDVGLDGLTNREEADYFRSYLNQVTPGLSPEARQRLLADPSGDDFQFYFGSKADSVRYIVSRYKAFMGMENNSPEALDRNELVTPASTVLPDIEDLNVDNTINESEAYYEYELDLRPGQLQVGRKYIVDKVEVEGTTWYLFRIPVREGRRVGDINGFKSIRFMRMYLTDFEQPVVLRFAQLQLTANQYRKYAGDLTAPGLQDVPEPYDAQFKVATVNIEENGSAGQNNQNKYIYQVPPGFERDRDFTQLNNFQLNEQSMSLSVTNLRDGDSRAAFKNTNLDLLFRERLRMFIHMHNEERENGQVSAFVRLGTDFKENYYEIEIPQLVATPDGPQSPEVVWPQQNELDLAIQELIDLKADRNREFSRLYSLPFTKQSLDGRYNLTVVGNPDLSAVQVAMIGVRNPKSPDEQTKTFTIWVNELRAFGFDQTAGRAAVATLNMKLADLGTVTASGRMSTFGFGGVQSRIADRARETAMEMGLSSALAVDKFFPEKWGLRIPVFLNFDRRRVIPHFNPLDPDTPLKTTLTTLSENDRDPFRKLVEENFVRRGINFSNVRKVRTGANAKAHFYDVENFSFSYAFNEAERTNIRTEQYLQRQARGGIAYVYSSQPKAFEPFRRFEGLERPYLRWLRDFNLTLLPTQVAVRAELDRSFIRTQLRNAELTTLGVPTLFEKFFYFNRFYDLTWNLTKNLVATYNARTNAIVDEPQGDINSQTKRDSVIANLKRLGRTRNFDQNITLNYRLPLDKFPLTDWISADVNYKMGLQFQANSFGIRDSANVEFGNYIRNSRDRGIQGRVDLIRLYNKIAALRRANTPSPPRRNFTRNPGDIEDIERQDSRLLKSFVRTLLTVRGINFNYTISETTFLPGFLRTPRFFGLDRDNAPGLPFVLGSQDRTIHYKAADRGWLSRSTVQNQPFQQSITKRFEARTTLEPFRDFRMQVDARLTRSDTYQEFYRPATPGGEFVSQSPFRNGQFSMSFLSFKTAFTRTNRQNISPVFDRFSEYRKIILDRLIRENPAASRDPEGYNLTSQDVLIPAFFAAYSGKDPNKVRMNPFLNIPLPNWRVDYNGLSQLAPFKKLFRSFTLAHSYSSTYSVGNFVSSLDYNALYVNLAVMNYPLAEFISQETGFFVPVFVMSTISMREQFAPFLGVNFQTQNRITGRVEYNQQRDVALSLSNAQVAELTNKDLTVGIGFTRNNFRVPFRIRGAYRRLKNDLTFNCNLTFRDTRSVQRKLEGDRPGENIIVFGGINFQLRPQISYIVNRRLNVQFYFDRTFNDPLVTNSYRRATTAGGVQVRFNLAD